MAKYSDLIITQIGIYGGAANIWYIMNDRLASIFNDDRGVSPVIGVILMVAITVIKIRAHTPAFP